MFCFAPSLCYTPTPTLFCCVQHPYHTTPNRRAVCFAPRPAFGSKMNIQNALARFLGGGDNWGGDRQDWAVPLGPFAEGRPRLAPGRRGEFIPVFDDQPTTIIAYR